MPPMTSLHSLSAGWSFHLAMTARGSVYRLTRMNTFMVQENNIQDLTLEVTTIPSGLGNRVSNYLNNVQI